ncbi:non-canonical purine NTP pyrophosphatase, RdgB/HAM1 family [Anoxybacter fermentans]|uniref:dITP/XTP pyrophosphatase n=1 Tax=Anoxybacter fermentans TaxID=1323375 RepID=A0A3Q9HQZ5_9FIRM|nr:XTP/dITP diphosphatase [Anoxybacter fermentans]AZR73384.1 non-canonical purine NTP pyrophosphatase, RdgB/HAM1 family [Anoxybacter fermentans]
MEKIVIASRNPYKVQELKALLKDESIQVLSLNHFPEIPEVVEDGKTFKENALKKAREICKATQLPTLADDSGLEVDLLDGAPGVYSARFAGPDATDADNNRKLLELLKDHPDLNERTARFKSVIALVLPDGRERVVEGSCEGLLLTEPRGQGGFGYDPLFYLPEYNATFAELPMEVKNRISHRGKAFCSIIEEIRKLK